MKRFIIMLVIALNSTLAYADEWKYSSSTDTMNDDTSHYASIVSDNSKQFAYPYHGETFGNLIVTTPPGRKAYLTIFIDRGQIECGLAGRPCYIKIRFDDQPAISFEVATLRGMPSNAVVGDLNNKTLELMTKASVIKVQLPVWREGYPVYEFSPTSALSLSK